VALEAAEPALDRADPDVRARVLGEAGPHLGFERLDAEVDRVAAHGVRVDLRAAIDVERAAQEALDPGSVALGGIGAHGSDQAGY
jgi:hypothetical protein